MEFYILGLGSHKQGFVTGCKIHPGVSPSTLEASGICRFSWHPSRGLLNPNRQWFYRQGSSALPQSYRAWNCNLEAFLQNKELRVQGFSKLYLQTKSKHKSHSLSSVKQVFKVDTQIHTCSQASELCLQDLILVLLTTTKPARNTSCP